VIKTIRAKIVWTFAVLVVLNLTSSYWAIYNFYAIATGVSTIIRENYQSVLAAENMVKSLERQDNALLVASQGEMPSADSSLTENRDLFKQYTENRDLFFYWYDAAVKAVGSTEQEPVRDSIQAAYRRYTLVGDSMSARIKQGAFEGAQDYYFRRVRPVSDELRTLCFRLFEINQQGFARVQIQTHSLANQTAFASLMASIVGLILSIIATAWLIRSFITPAELLTDRVKQIGAGKVDLKIDVLSDDEIGQLSREFNKMTERLRQYDEMNIDKILAEKRKSEVIVDSIADGLIMTDATLRVIHVNKVIADLFGIDELASIGKDLRAVIPDARLLGLISQSARANGELQEQSITFLQFERNGETLYFRPKLTTLRDREGRLFGIVALLQDITQFKELDRMKSEFIATVSHEFRTPVTSINMSIDILNQELLGPLTARQKDLVTSAKEDCHRLTKLARELLQLAKIESGRIQLHEEELQIAEVIGSSLHPLQIQFQEKNVRLVTDLQPDLPPLRADEQQVSWVITNLVTNALKHTPAGGTVTVSGRRDGESLRVEVQDTGVGIPREFLAKVFDKFVQVKQSSDTTPGSVGLGLAIAKEIVEMYGGRIWADSEVGKGSTFAFVLPFRMTHAISSTPRGGA
jgi:two-component system, NtrC family, sensor histidine kinase KinB